MLDLKKIGISSLRTPDFGFSGRVLSSPDDFTVQEIGDDGAVVSSAAAQNFGDEGKNGAFLVFTLVKKGLSTQEALHRLSKATGFKMSRFGYAGNKDKNALTYQRISVFKARVSNFKTEYGGMHLEDFAYRDNGVKIGTLYGNRFTVRIRDFRGEDLEAFRAEAERGLPNFYGPQRFGESALNVSVSKSALAGDFKGALLQLVFSERLEGPLGSEARARLKDTFYTFVSDDADVDREEAGKLLAELPGFMHTETAIIRRLLSAKHDYVGAFRLIPKYLRLLILQSYQSYLFNMTVSKLLSETYIPTDVPAFGHDLDIGSVADAPLRSALEKVAEEEKVQTSAFAIKSMPELTLKSFVRPALFVPENLSFLREGDDLLLKFDLKKGSYATILLLEMLRKF
jgi:tRNA pseudouridine13 synthase